MVNAMFLAAFLIPSFADAGDCDRSMLKGIDFVDVEKHPLPLDYCSNPEGLQAKVVLALGYLENIAGGSFPWGTLDQGILNSGPFLYFKKQVRFVLTLHCPMPAQRNDQDSLIVCPSFAGYDLLTQAEILVHEARHQDGGDHHKHVRCGSQVPGLEGQLGCDSRYEDKGSYAASAEFYLKLSRAPIRGLVTEELKQLCRERALYYLNCRMNEPFTKLNTSPVRCNGLP